jgi:hypothetical protein
VFRPEIGIELRLINGGAAGSDLGLGGEVHLDGDGVFLLADRLVLRQRSVAFDRVCRMFNYSGRTFFWEIVRSIRRSGTSHIKATIA